MPRQRSGRFLTVMMGIYLGVFGLAALGLLLLQAVFG